MPKPSRVDNYLLDVLALDFNQEFGQIMELRARFQSPPAKVRRGTGARADAVTPSATAAADGVPPREQAARKIHQIRAKFWDANETSIGKAIRAVKADAFPDLQRALDRLSLVNELRDEVDALEDAPKVRPEHITPIRAVLVSPSKEAASARDQLARRLGTKSRASQAKPLVKAIKDNAPGIAELESEWLVRLRGAKKERKDSRVAAGGIGCLGAYVFVSVVRRLIEFIYDWMQAP